MEDQDNERIRGMTIGCETCDTEGPAMSKWQGDGVAAHRAMHDAGRAVVLSVEAVTRFVSSWPKRSDLLSGWARL